MLKQRCLFIYIGAGKRAFTILRNHKAVGHNTCIKDLILCCPGHDLRHDIDLGGNPGFLPRDLDGLDQWTSLTLNLPSQRSFVLLNIDEKQRYAAIIKGSWKLIVGKFFGNLTTKKISVITVVKHQK